ncbi:hypothetical protein [Methyloversatilis thermotolerans]|uniref:hypothetical protein n=1 Tax=Methyloversatilis thermotolerans TaxID=1346290 RepID=UPI00037DBD4F|nr:hypothetical protein [Methyloversatilis thermotolerans]
MARSLIAALPAAPDVTSLNAALKRAGFALRVEAEWDDPDHTGFTPCTLDGEDAGFELKRSPGQLQVRWSGDPREHAAALAVVAVLADAFGAQVSAPDSDAPLSPPELKDNAHALFEGL